MSSRVDILESEIRIIQQKLGASRVGKQFNPKTAIDENLLFYVYDHVNDETFHIQGDVMSSIFNQVDYTVNAVTENGATNIYQVGIENPIFSISNEPPVVSDTNTNPNKHEIALIEGQQVNESVTDLLTPTVQSGNIVRFEYVNEEGITVVRNADFSALVPTTNVNLQDGDSYDSATMIITVVNQNGTSNNIDLKTFLNTVDILTGGITSLKQGGVELMQLSKSAISGRLNDLISDMNGNAFFSGNDVSLTLSLTTTSGQVDFLSIGNGDALLASTKSVGLTGANSSIALNSSGISVNRPVNYTSNQHGNYSDRSLIDKEFSFLATRHLFYNKITYYFNSGDLEANLNTLTGDYFLVATTTEIFFAVKKTAGFEAENLTIKIDGDIVDEIEAVSVQITGKSATLTTSYNVYDATVMGGLDHQSGNSYDFCFWRKKNKVKNLPPVPVTFISPVTGSGTAIVKNSVLYIDITSMQLNANATNDSQFNMFSIPLEYGADYARSSYVVLHESGGGVTSLRTLFTYNVFAAALQTGRVMTGDYKYSIETKSIT